MKCKNWFFIWLFVAAGAVSAGSQTCPGPTNRTALINLQKGTTVEGTKAGQIPLTDTCGNLRYAQYVEVNLVPIAYTPTTTGNTQNLSEFVTDPGGVLWYIDWQGNAVELSGGGGACDEDFLQISDNSCPDALTDSIYKYKYVAIGARGVWPAAELLVNDSTALGMEVISGNRNARLALHDNANDTWSVIDQGGSTTRHYVQPEGLWQVLTGTGSPQSLSVGTEHFGVNTLDSTVILYQYPNTREDTSNAVNFLYTNPDGVVQSKPISAIVGPVLANQGATVNGDTVQLGTLYTTPETSLPRDIGPNGRKLVWGNDDMGWACQEFNDPWNYSPYSLYVAQDSATLLQAINGDNVSRVSTETYPNLWAISAKEAPDISSSCQIRPSQAKLYSTITGLYSSEILVQYTVELNSTNNSSGSSHLIADGTTGLSSFGCSNSTLTQNSYFVSNFDSLRNYSSNLSGTSDVSIKPGEIALRSLSDDDAIYVRGGSGVLLKGTASIQGIADSIQFSTVPDVAKVPALVGINSVGTLKKIDGTTTGDVMTWNGTSWEPAAPAGGASLANNGVIINNDTIQFGRYYTTPVTSNPRNIGPSPRKFVTGNNDMGWTADTWNDLNLYSPYVWWMTADSATLVSAMNGGTPARTWIETYPGQYFINSNTSGDTKRSYMTVQNGSNNSVQLRHTEGGFDSFVTADQNGSEIRSQGSGKSAYVAADANFANYVIVSSGTGTPNTIIVHPDTTAVVGRISYNSDLSSTFTDNSAASVLYVENADRERIFRVPNGASPQTFSSTVRCNFVNQGGTQASFTFNLPGSPKDGDISRVLFNNAVTTLTISGNGNSTVGTFPVTAATGDVFEFQFVSGTGWFRLK